MILSDIIENEQFGEIVGEASDGSEIDIELLAKKKVDILLIDLLMPHRDGLETIRAITPDFTGKIVMLSQVEIKELIGEAYSLGIDYYILKPINKLEVINVLKKVSERIILENSIHNFQASLRQINSLQSMKGEERPLVKDKSIRFQTECQGILAELGILSEGGHKDIIDILEILFESSDDTYSTIPSLKLLFEQAAQKNGNARDELQKEVKASEQRVRRAIHHSLNHIAALGLDDYTNPIFEQYAAKFFDFSQVRLKMYELKLGYQVENQVPRINIKKFIQALYWEVLKQMEA
jgi:two-component system response regulator YcbB